MWKYDQYLLVVFQFQKNKIGPQVAHGPQVAVNQYQQSRIEWIELEITWIIFKESNGELRIIFKYWNGFIQNGLGACAV